MPRWLRIFLTGLSFAMFFGAGLGLGLAFAPLLLLGLLVGGKWHRRVCTRFLGHAYGSFNFWMKLVGLIDYPRFEVPERVRGRPCLVIANHPSLIDVLFLLYWFEGLTSLVKAHWYRSPFVSLLLRSTDYLPGPRADETEEGANAPVLHRMVDHLKAGHSIQIFPEGTRSYADRLHRFKRGAFEAAVRAGVPVVCVFIGVDRPFLMKGVPFYRVPRRRARYHFEVLRVVEPGEYRDSLSFRNEVQGLYRKRFARWLAESGRAGRDASSGQSGKPALDGRSPAGAADGDQARGDAFAA